MAITSQTGKLSFGGQSAKETEATTYYQHRASDIDLAAISDDRLGPPEVGGINTPTIPYRAGLVATGGATLNPRLEDTFGWLLYGALGAHSVTADEDVLGNTVTGYQHHEFTFDTDTAFIPWMSFRKEVPAVDATTDHGEIYVDCKILNFALALPNDGLITTRLDVLGRMATGTQFESNPSWSYDNTQMEDYPSIPIGSVTGGYLKIPTFSATALPITAANVTLTNAPLDMRQEKVFGSPYLEDVTITGRALTVDMVVKWTDPQLYRSILTGTTNGTNWTAAPFVSDLDVVTRSPSLAGTTGESYALRVEAPAVMYQVVGGIRLAGNNAVMLRVQGTAIASTSDYVTVHLGNEATAYTWPT